MLSKKIKPVATSLAAAALTAVAFAAVSVAKDDGNKGEADRADGGGATFEHRIGPPGRDLSDEDRAAFESFRKCMEDQGAPAPPAPGNIGEGERPEPPSEADMDKIRKAMDACRDKLPEGADLRFGPPGCGPPPGEDREDGEDGTQERGEGAVLPAPAPGPPAPSAS